jgi:hypothetical protein
MEYSKRICGYNVADVLVVNTGMASVEDRVKGVYIRGVVDYKLATVNDGAKYITSRTV